MLYKWHQNNQFSSVISVLYQQCNDKDLRRYEWRSQLHLLGPEFSQALTKQVQQERAKYFDDFVCPNQLYKVSHNLILSSMPGCLQMMNLHMSAKSFHVVIPHNHLNLSPRSTLHNDLLDLHNASSCSITNCNVVSLKLHWSTLTSAY